MSEIAISIKGKWRGAPEAMPYLEQVRIWVERTFVILKDRWDFNLPDKFVIRPIYVKRRRGFSRYRCLGRAGYYGSETYIAINLAATPKSDDGGLYVAMHEACHIADYMTSGRLGHTKQFKEMLKYSRQYVETFRRKDGESS